MIHPPAGIKLKSMFIEGGPTHKGDTIFSAQNDTANSPWNDRKSNMKRHRSLVSHK